MTAFRRGQSWALVPVKRAEGAKSRLAPVLAVEERQALQRAMLRDVLASLGKSRRLDGIAVITADPQAGEISRQSGALVLADPGHGLNPAVTAGVRALRDAGGAIIAVIPADIPLLLAREIDAALARVRREQVTIVGPDRHGLGTNALIFPADAAPAFGFGAGSCRRHLAGAGAVQRLPSLELDLDLPEDLERFMAEVSAERTAPHTHGVLASVRHRFARTMHETPA
jgi:2-phospho-L-lactate guanylyltransferase